MPTYPTQYFYILKPKQICKDFCFLISDQADAAFLLLQKGVDINCQTAGKQTPLHLAATTPDHAKTLEMLLLDKRINPTLRNGANETAYEIAKRSGPHHQLFELVDPRI